MTPSERVGVVLPAWQRHALLPAVVTTLREQTVPPARIVVVGSQDPAMRLLAAALDCAYVDAPNRPLGRKWNAGFAACRDLDAVLVSGSDNLLGPRWIETCLEHLRAPGVVMVGSADLFVLDLGPLRLVHFLGYDPRVRTDPIGAGRLLGTAALRPLEFAYCPDDADASLDFVSAARVRAAHPAARVVTFRCSADASVLDVKTGTNETSFASLPGATIAEPIPWLRSRFVAGAVDSLLEAREGLR